jgi:hypothetical protein
MFDPLSRSLLKESECKRSPKGTGKGDDSKRGIAVRVLI